MRLGGCFRSRSGQGRRGYRSRRVNGCRRRCFQTFSRIGATSCEFTQLVLKVTAHPGAIFAFEVAQVFDARFESSALQLGITVGILHLALRLDTNFPKSDPIIGFFSNSPLLQRHHSVTS